ncbi:MAG: hypothetical protein QOG79_6326, partial [Mycobacterium sp.]|nr:hypothetical protein [Mycobacterium sp.]
VAPKATVDPYILAQRELSRLPLRELARMSQVSNAYLSQVARQARAVVACARSDGRGAVAASGRPHGAGASRRRARQARPRRRRSHRSDAGRTAAHPGAEGRTSRGVLQPSGRRRYPAEIRRLRLEPRCAVWHREVRGDVNLNPRPKGAVHCALTSSQLGMEAHRPPEIMDNPCYPSAGAPYSHSPTLSPASRDAPHITDNIRYP